MQQACFLYNRTILNFLPLRKVQGPWFPPPSTCSYTVNQQEKAYLQLKCYLQDKEYLILLAADSPDQNMLQFISQVYYNKVIRD